VLYRGATDSVTQSRLHAIPKADEGREFGSVISPNIDSERKMFLVSEATLIFAHLRTGTLIKKQRLLM
jgi:hypothetical protein